MLALDRSSLGGTILSKLLPQAGTLSISHPLLEQRLVLSISAGRAGAGGGGRLVAQGASLPAAGDAREVQVCGDKVCCSVLAAAVAGGCSSHGSSQEEWFQRAVGVRCTLVQQQDRGRLGRLPQQPLQHEQQQRVASGVAASPSLPPAIGFANEAQLLLVSEGSVSQLGRLLRARDPTAPPLGALRFRPNLVVSGAPAFDEDGWQRLEVVSACAAGAGAGGGCGSAAGVWGGCGAGGGAVALAVVGPCGRCEMVEVEQGTGRRQGSALMRVLAESRRRRGRLEFGVLLALQGVGQGAVLRVGDRLAAS
jgi:molybdenum cofactor sulfurtransferase